jgi:hypothetical protein
MREIFSARILVYVFVFEYPSHHFAFVRLRRGVWGGRKIPIGRASGVAD